MANLDRGPFWTKQKAWEPADELETHKVHFESQSKTCLEVFPCDRTFGIKFLLANTLPQFLEAYKEQKWNYNEGYTKFG